jgi:hypothetical protein
LIAVACLALSAGRAGAEDFWYLASNPPSFDFVDADTISAEPGGHIKAWVTSVIGGKPDFSSSVRTALKEEFFRCGRKQIALVQAMQYGEHGDVISSSHSGVILYDDVVPGSFGSEELNFVCSSHKSRTSTSYWVHIAVTPETFADNAVKALHANIRR